MLQDIFASSDDALSSDEEFYDNEHFEFMRPSEEVMLKSIPIVPTQPASTQQCFVILTLILMSLLYCSW